MEYQINEIKNENNNNNNCNNTNTIINLVIKCTKIIYNKGKLFSQENFKYHWHNFQKESDAVVTAILQFKHFLFLFLLFVVVVVCIVCDQSQMSL